MPGMGNMGCSGWLALIPETASLLDKQQSNSEVRAASSTLAIFVYGFLIVIGLVALINIVNTVNASISLPAS